MNTKICTKCNVEKELSEFYSNKKSNDGVRTVCKICMLVYQKSYDSQHKEYIKDYNKKYHSEYYEDNKEIMAIKNKIFYENNKEYFIEYHRARPEMVRKSNHDSHSKRRGWGKVIPINTYFEGSHLHHTHLNSDHQACIYIPAELHRSTWHAYNRPELMDEINKLAFEWLATCDVI